MKSFKQYLKETKIPFLRGLERKFGNMVYSDEYIFSFNSNNAVFLFEYINKFIFDNYLIRPAIRFRSLAELNKNDKVKHVYAVYRRIPLYQRLNNGLYKGDIMKGTDKIVLPVDKMSMPFGISCLCHEMIHVYLDQQTTCLDAMAESYFEHKAFNPHNTEFFKNKKQLAIKNGICVMEYVNNKSFDELNDLAIKVTKKVGGFTIDENEANELKKISKAESKKISDWINSCVSGSWSVINKDGYAELIS